MKSFVPYLLLLFLLWVVMNGNLGTYLKLASTTTWHISAKSLFAGVFSSGSSSSSNSSAASQAQGILSSSLSALSLINPFG